PLHDRPRSAHALGRLLHTLGSGWQLARVAVAVHTRPSSPQLVRTSSRQPSMPKTHSTSVPPSHADRGAAHSSIPMQGSTTSLPSGSSVVSMVSLSDGLSSEHAA